MKKILKKIILILILLALIVIGSIVLANKKKIKNVNENDNKQIEENTPNVEEKENYKEAAKILMSNLEVKNQLCVDNIKGSMRVIVWCIKEKKIFLLNMYLKVRDSIRKLYRRMKGK